MSFSDTAGDCWSILYESIDSMTIMIRMIVATMCHIASYSGITENKLTHITRLLPSVTGSEPRAVEETPLSLGMTAGVHVIAWEIGDLNDYPIDLSNREPLQVMQSEIVKVR